MPPRLLSDVGVLVDVVLDELVSTRTIALLRGNRLNVVHD
jgi:hypothetical protein